MSSSNTSSHAETPAVETSWHTLMIYLHANPLPTLVRPVIPTGTPIEFFGYIHAAHNTGVISSRGTLIPFPIPDESTTTCGASLWYYYNSGFVYGLCLWTEPTTAPTSSTRTAPKLSEPEPFDGIRDKFSQFVIRLSLIFNSDPTRYHTDAAKIPYAASYLTGSAAAWFDPYMDKTTSVIAFATYGDFMTAQKNAYDDPDAKATAE